MPGENNQNRRRGAANRRRQNVASRLLRNYFANPDSNASRLLNHSIDENGNEIIEMQIESGLNDEDVEDEYDNEIDEDENPFGEDEDEDDHPS